MTITNTKHAVLKPLNVVSFLYFLTTLAVHDLHVTVSFLRLAGSIDSSSGGASSSVNVIDSNTTNVFDRCTVSFFDVVIETSLGASTGIVCGNVTATRSSFLVANVFSGYGSPWASMAMVSTSFTQSHIYINNITVVAKDTLRGGFGISFLAGTITATTVLISNMNLSSESGLVAAMYISVVAAEMLTPLLP